MRPESLSSRAPHRWLSAAHTTEEGCHAARNSLLARPTQVAVMIAGREDSRVTCTGVCRPAPTCLPRSRVEGAPAPLFAGAWGALRAWRADRFGNRVCEVRCAVQRASLGQRVPCCKACGATVRHDVAHLLSDSAHGAACTSVLQH